jgi:hypothetical protein
MERFKTYLRYTETAALFFIAFWASTILWQDVINYYKAPDIELVGMTVDNVDIIPGNEFVLTTHVIKRRDCSGTFSTKIQDSKGHYTTIQEGFLGQKPPSEYYFPKKVRMPFDIISGPATISQTLVMSCDDSGNPTISRNSVEANIK